jgi:hypothetical protein
MQALRDSSAKGEDMLRGFINDALKRGEFTERLSNHVSFSDGLYNSIIYTEVLAYIDPEMSLEALRMGDDVIGKAETVRENAEILGITLPIKSVHLAMGTDFVHFLFISHIAACAYRKEIQKLETTESTIHENEMEAGAAGAEAGTNTATSNCDSKLLDTAGQGSSSNVKNSGIKARISKFKLFNIWCSSSSAQIN